VSGFVASAPALGVGDFAARAAVALEAAVSRLSLEPSVSSVSWSTSETAAPLLSTEE
jgi:hypothetical protein